MGGSFILSFQSRSFDSQKQMKYATSIPICETMKIHVKGNVLFAYGFKKQLRCNVVRIVFWHYTTNIDFLVGLW